MKKQIISFLILLIVLIPVCFAVGDDNITGGGGDTGDGDTGATGSYWNAGRDGVRVSIMDGNYAVTTFDIANKDWEGWVEVAFNIKNKLDYKRGEMLARSNGYTNILLPADLKMPRIIAATSQSNGNTIEAIRRYFTDEATVRYLAEISSIPYEDLISGTYKLMIEPMSYFTYRGDRYAMSATECALFDWKISMGDLSYRMGKLTHQNQPFSMFLERSEFGIAPWTGGTTGKQSAYTIMEFLGVGAVTFTEVPEIPEGDEAYTFRTDKDVIVSINIQNTSSADITPDDNAYLDIDIGGTTYRRQFVCPAGESQLVWVKWQTPDTPQIVDITAICDNIPQLSKRLSANIEELIENTPPDPKYEDTNPSFNLIETPDHGSVTSNTWGEWYTYWVHESKKHWEDDGHDSSCDDDCDDDHEWWWRCTEDDCDIPDIHGKWEFEYTTYSASLYVDFSIEPDEQVPTAYKSRGEWVMASGYGINANAEITVAKSDNASVYDVTPVQSMITTYPEFGFENYTRFMETEDAGPRHYRNIDWTLQENPYSFYSNPVHFTPLWYPDDVQYVVSAVAFDAWTPAGMLHTTVEDEMLIFLSVLDDWYIAVVDE